MQKLLDILKKLIKNDKNTKQNYYNFKIKLKTENIKSYQNKILRKLC